MAATVRQYDYLIIGAGIIGLSIARELRRRSRRTRICIIDSGSAGREASFAAAGMLAPNIEGGGDVNFARLCREAIGRYPRFAGELLDDTGIDVELDRSGTLLPGFSEAEFARTRRQIFDRQAEAGDLFELSSKELRQLEPLVSPTACGALFFPNDWQVENRKLIAALIKYAALNRIDMIENVRVGRVETQGGRAVGVAAADGLLRSETVVVAAGAWSSLIALDGARLPLDVAPVKGQIICFRIKPAAVKKVIFGPNGYLVPRRDGRILVGATVENAGFDKSVTTGATAALRRAAFEMMPSLANLNICESWAGLRPAAPDKLPVIGRIADVAGLTIATAHYRNGILLAPLTAEIVADALIDNRDSEIARPFSPERFAVGLHSEFV